jgi:hypothetical protein
MIVYDSEELKATDDAIIRNWLIQSGCQLVRHVVESRLKKAQVEALAEALRHNSDLGHQAATAFLKRGERYQHFIEVLDEIMKQPQNQRFDIARLK